MTKVADERLGAFLRFQQDITAKVIKGSLDPDIVENLLRPVIGQMKKLLPFLKENNITYSHFVEEFINMYTDNTVIYSDRSIQSMNLESHTHFKVAKWLIGYRQDGVDHTNVEKLLSKISMITLGDFLDKVLRSGTGSYFTFLKVGTLGVQAKKQNFSIAIVYAYWDKSRIMMPTIEWFEPDSKILYPGKFVYPMIETGI